MTGLPRLLVLTDRTQCADLVATVATAVGCGASAVVLREKDLPASQRAELAARLRELVPLVIVAGQLPDADAVHLAAADPLPDPRPALVGRSCHDAAEVAAAAGQRCDYVTVSPIYPTASKPGYGPALGPAGLAALTAGPPVFALGGVEPSHVDQCRAAGAYGVAVMGSVMREPRRVLDYLAALEQEQS